MTTKWSNFSIAPGKTGGNVIVVDFDLATPQGVELLNPNYFY